MGRPSLSLSLSVGLLGKRECLRQVALTTAIIKENLALLSSLLFSSFLSKKKKDSVVRATHAHHLSPFFTWMDAFRRHFSLPSPLPTLSSPHHSWSIRNCRANSHGGDNKERERERE